MSASSLAGTHDQACPVSNEDSPKAAPTRGLTEPRILIVDDTRAIHEDFRKILAQARRPALDDVEAALFDSPGSHSPRANFVMDSAFQGPEGLAMVERSLQQGRRYALAFVDIRMPPGWDGIETTARLWAADPDLQVCICTAYSDYSWDQMVNRFGTTDNLLILKKPFDTLEVMQIAHALTRKWVLLQQSKWRLEDLDHTVARRTQDLRAANRKLLEEISERNRSEEDLRASEERFRSVWEHSADGMRLTDHAGRIIVVNEAYCGLVGLPREKLLGELFSVVYDEHDLQGDLDEYRQRFNTGAIVPRLATQVQLWNSRRLDLEISNSFIELGNQRKLVLSIFRDITQRNRVELRAAAFSTLGQRLSTARTASEAGTIIVEVADQLLGWDACSFALYSPANDKVTQVLNFDLINGQRAPVPPGYDQSPPSPLARRAIAEGGQLIFRGDTTHRLDKGIPFGDTARLSESLLYVPIRNGKDVTGVLSIQSYTPQAYDQRSLETLQALADHCGAALDRIRAGEALRSSQAQLQLQFDRMPIACITWTPEFRVSSWNLAAERIFGFSAEEARGKHPFELIVPKDVQPRLDKTLRRLLDGEATTHNLNQNLTKDGRSIICEWTSTPLRGPDDKVIGVLSMARDVTEFRLLEQQLRQSQKMEAIGQLAGGVAHDFNNLLAVIRGNAELLLMSDDQPRGPAADCLKQVVAAADRAANLTRQLLAFSRKQVMQSQPLNLNDVIGNLAKMLHRIIGEPIELQCGYAAGLPFVQADVGMLEQVLLNLVVNARDAMPKGGRLLITTEKVTLDAAYAQAHRESRPGDFVALNVTDTGTGIAPEHLPRIFEPFFTTKELGKGTGLGLATVYGIVKQHQGWIDVSSQLGAGSTFRILLPAIETPATVPGSEPVEAKPRGGSESILLVEDDEAVRALTSRLLESFGYRVLEAASGPQALELWRADMARIDLLLTDMVMPAGMTGRELADQLLAQRPNLKIIFLSGYSGDVAGKDTSFIRRTRSRFLQKPCHWRLLLQTVRQSLDDNPQC